MGRGVRTLQQRHLEEFLGREGTRCSRETKSGDPQDLGREGRVALGDHSSVEGGEDGDLGDQDRA